MSIASILNERLRGIEDCRCSLCEKRKNECTDFKCELCGYAGRPAATQCACYDYRCSGGSARGAGCFHGSLCCPVCDDGNGELDPWEVIRRIRAAITSSAPPAPDVKVEGES